MARGIFVTYLICIRNDTERVREVTMPSAPCTHSLRAVPATHSLRAMPAAAIILLPILSTVKVDIFSKDG